MNLIKIFLSATLLVLAFSMSGCQGNNSDSPENNVTNPIPISPADNNLTLPATLVFVNGSEVNATSSGQIIDVVIIVKNALSTTDVEGDISVQYLTNENTGLVTNSPATISNGIVSFSYTAPNDLQGAVDSNTTFSELRFFSIDNPLANVTLKINYTPQSSIVVGEPILQTLTLSESTINITQSEETKALTLFAYTNQSTTDINLSIGIQYGDTGIGDTGIDVGYFSPSSPSVVDGRVSFIYNGPLNLLTTSATLATTTFTLYDKANSGITTPLTVNFLPNVPVIRVESPTVTLTTDAQVETVTILAFDSTTNKAFESGTILVQYPTDITDGSVSGGTFTQNEATIVNGKAIFTFNGPNPLTTIVNQTFTFKYKENQTVSTALTMQYTPDLPQIASLAINQATTAFSTDKQLHTVIINALDANSNFVNNGTINVKFPSEISNGTDLGTFTSFSIAITNGQATFDYIGPTNILATSAITATETFIFTDAANNANTVNWITNFTPDTPVIRMDESNVTVTVDSEVLSIKVLAFDSNNQSLQTGTISMSYPTEIVNANVNGGLFSQTEVAISNGEAIFTFTGPANLTADISSLDFTFKYKENVNVSPVMLTVNYAPLSAAIYLNETTKEVTLNSETFNIDVDVRDSNNNPYTTGSVKIVYPDDVKSGRDIGSFISSEILLDATGKAGFVYTAPKSLDANESNITFGFYHDSEPTLVKEFIVTINPEPNQVILTDYALTSSYADGNITMDLVSTKLITFYVKDKDGNLLGDSNITSIVVTVLNTALADLDDSNASNAAADEQTLDKNSASLSIISNTVSGVVPIKAVATFKGVNNENVTITEVFNVVIVSGPPTAMSISYVSSATDAENAKFVEKMVVAITDKYSNRVNNNPGLSVALIAGYAPDASGPLGYMYHTHGGVIDTTDDKIKVASGTVMQATVTNGGDSYSLAPSVTYAGGDGNFAATAYLSTYGGISNITLLSAGKEYVTAPTVSATGSGSGFTATATLATTGTFFTTKTSTVTGLPIINLDNAGQGYTGVPTISVTTPNAGAGFDAVAVLEDTGAIKSISIDAPGSGYAVGDVLAVDGDGTGGSVKVKTVDGEGAITSISLLNAGSGYTSASIDTLTAGNKDATLSATIGFSIKEIQLGDGGSGYDDEAITVSGGTPTVNAIASSQIGYSVATVTVNSVGSGYRSATIVFSNEGDGSQASALATIKYPVSNIEITNGGAGYADGSLTLTAQGGDTGTGATATATIFSDFSTVTENGSVNDEFLMTFANNYTYNASGKWDITSVGANDDFERVLKDQFDGATTSNLGFAIGNNFRQDVCKFGQEWVATAVTPVAEFDSNGLAQIDITYDYYLAAKDVILSANLAGVQNSLGETVKIGEAIKHSLRGSALIASDLSLPAGLDHAIYRIDVELDGTPTGSFRNSNFAYTIQSASSGLIIHRVSDSMDDGIHTCPVHNDEGRAYVEVEVSTTLASQISLGDLAISREFK